ncbi:MAG: Uma2 family endonuclease, partial [Syntrophobacteraceae bacterium]|nr:Uma2 family endonuclease [Syntrophobacteraceae bacterium]
MSEPAKKSATYKDLFEIPDNMIAEIIDGELIASPRPAPRHAHAATVLSNILGRHFHRSGAGPGGWVFLYEVEIKLGENILVPDLAGWKEKRFPTAIEHNWIPVPPDW